MAYFNVFIVLVLTFIGLVLYTVFGSVDNISIEKLPDQMFLGWGESFHFAQQNVDEDYSEAIHRHEERLMDKMFANDYEFQDAKILDLGCGIGGPMMNFMKHHPESYFIGINNDKDQVDYGNMLIEEREYVNGKILFPDFGKLNFKDSSINGIYSIEALFYATNLLDVFNEVERVLKPGSTFTFYTWIASSQYDALNPNHVNLLSEISQDASIPQIMTRNEILAVAQEAGLTFVSFEDLAEDLIDHIPWYSRLDFPKWFLTVLKYFNLLMSQISPENVIFSENHESLHISHLLVEAGKQRIFSPIALIEFKK